MIEGARAPLAVKEPELEGDREGDQERGLRSSQPGAQAFLSACYMWDKRGRWTGGARKLLAIKQIRFLATISNCLLHISPRLSKHSSWQLTMVRPKLLIYNTFTPQLDPPSVLLISLNVTIMHA